VFLGVTEASPALLVSIFENVSVDRDEFCSSMRTGRSFRVARPDIVVLTTDLCYTHTLQKPAP